MFVAEVAFSTNKENEQQLYNKVKKTQSELHNVAGLKSSEVWTKSKSDDVEYVVVSKWDEKKIFKIGLLDLLMLKSIRQCIKNLKMMKLTSHLFKRHYVNIQ